MKNTENQKSNNERALHEARRKYAIVSITNRYEALRKDTGLNGAERFQQLKINQNVD